MNDDKSLFAEKYIITGLHKIETDGYWSLINDILGRIGALLSEWFEAKNKQRVHLRVDEHPIYIIYPGALRSEQ